MTIFTHALHVVHVTNIKLQEWSLNPGQVKKSGLMDSRLTCSTSSRPILSIRISYFTSYLISFHRQESWGSTNVHICMFLPPWKQPGPGARVVMRKLMRPFLFILLLPYTTISGLKLTPLPSAYFLVLVDKEDVEMKILEAMTQLN